MYRFLLEKNYGIEIEGGIVLGLHPGLPNGRIDAIEVDDMQEKIRQMFKSFS